MRRIDNTEIVNLALIFVIALCAGGISGFLVGGFPPPAPPSERTHGLPIHYPETLSVENTWIVADFSCPEPGCNKMLLECQNNLPRRICSWINQELARGRSGEDIRQALIIQHGEKLNKRSGGSAE